MQTIQFSALVIFTGSANLPSNSLLLLVFCFPSSAHINADAGSQFIAFRFNQIFKKRHSKMTLFHFLYDFCHFSEISTICLFQNSLSIRNQYKCTKTNLMIIFEYFWIFIYYCTLKFLRNAQINVINTILFSFFI